MAYPIGIDPDGRGRETIRTLGLDRDVLQEGLFETLESLALPRIIYVTIALEMQSIMKEKEYFVIR